MMAEAERNRHRDFSRFDKMSTETLREILRQDSYLYGQEDADADVVLYIMEVIRKREEEKPEAGLPGVDEAWASFNRDYRPYASAQPLYADEEDTKDEKAGRIAPPCVPKTGGRRKLLRFAAAVAAVFVIVFTGSVTAYAFGFDLWGRIISWTDETFNLTSDTVRNADIKTKELKAALKEAGIEEGWAPSYIPDGYEQGELNVHDFGAAIMFVQSYVKNENCIVVNITKIIDREGFGISAEKDVENPEIYLYKDIRFYIMENFGKYLTTWFSDDLEGNISGVDTYEELINIIESIEVEK